MRHNWPLGRVVSLITLILASVVLFLVYRKAFQQGHDALVGCAIGTGGGIILSLGLLYLLDHDRPNS